MNRYVVEPEPWSHIYFCVKNVETGKIIEWGLSRQKAEEIAGNLNLNRIGLEKNL